MDLRPRRALILYRQRHTEFFLKSFKLARLFSVIATLLQIRLGDGSGRALFVSQAAKAAAAIDAHWKTKSAMAAERLGNRGRQRTVFACNRHSGRPRRRTDRYHLRWWKATSCGDTLIFMWIGIGTLLPVIWVYNAINMPSSAAR
ncbi:MAG TPA: cytochrome ubiquinol oxidase subunit I [Thiobacillaceae bacterium]|nr:cytochrome ubiquinol oxidase subunit I [Thiobacillaceae bacterium]